MSYKGKKILLGFVDLLLAVYVVMCFSSLNKPEKRHNLCKQVYIEVADARTDGFISAAEVKRRMVRSNLFPVGRYLEDVNCRSIEDMLLRTPFVNTADCYKNQQGELFVKITQRLPLVRIKNCSGEDYYVDDNFCIMPNTQFTSDMIIATGNISRNYATTYVAALAKVLSGNEIYRNLFEQINITADHGVELVPRIGDHVVYLGHFPRIRFKSQCESAVRNFVDPKLQRLILFYKYGLPEAGWNKYSVVNMEFRNQIVCVKKGSEQEAEQQSEQAALTPKPQTQVEQVTEPEKKEETTEEKKPEKKVDKKPEKKDEAKPEKKVDKKPEKKDEAKPEKKTEKKPVKKESEKKKV